jgi:hypothetical protein
MLSLRSLLYFSSVLFSFDAVRRGGVDAEKKVQEYFPRPLSAVLGAGVSKAAARRLAAAAAAAAKGGLASPGRSNLVPLDSGILTDNLARVKHC